MASDWDVTNKRLRSNYRGRACQERRWATWEKAPSIIPKRHTRGSRVGRERGKWVPQSCRKSTQCMQFWWIFSLEKASQKVFENHYTITYPDALPLDFRVMKSAAVQEILWVNRIARSDSPVSSAHLPLQGQILKITQQPQNEQDFQRFLLVTTAKRLGLPKAGGRAAGCSLPFKNTHSAYESLDENWILTFY